MYGMRVVAECAVVADADPADRDAVAALLRRLGLPSLLAAGGEEALEVFERERPGLVVLDVGLPGTSAYEVCRALRERHGDHLPIVFVSKRRVEPADQVAGLLLGADDYFAKPLRTDLFLARLRRLLVRAFPYEQGERSSLTPREQEVLELLVQGVAPTAIAERLCVTPKTTSTHIEHILHKLGAHSQAQAVAFAVRDHLVDTAA
jgi:DNA-binding NarL/FixJ family response regulator